MNRKDFFKRLGIGVAAIVVAPKVLAEETEPSVSLEVDYDDPHWNYIPQSSTMDIVLYDEEAELPEWQYKRHTVSTWEKSICIPIKGHARITNIVFLDHITQKSIGGIIYGIGWDVYDGMLTIIR